MSIAIEFLHPLRGEVPPLDARHRDRLEALSACLEAAESLDEAFDLLSTNLEAEVPFDRLGLAVLTDGGTRIQALRVHSTHGVCWGEGESRPLLGSSLEPMLRERAVRIIHDLKGYQNLRPSSLSTKRLIEEGMRSSLTLPIFKDERPLGVLFVTSAHPDTYRPEHASLLVALSPAIDHAFGRLISLPAPA